MGPVMVRRPRRGGNGVTRVRILHDLFFIVLHTLLTGCADHCRVGPLLESQHDAGVDADGADEFDGSAGSVKVVRSNVLLEDVKDLEDGHDNIDEKEKEDSDGYGW